MCTIRTLHQDRKDLFPGFPRWICRMKAKESLASVLKDVRDEKIEMEHSGTTMYP